MTNEQHLKLVPLFRDATPAALSALAQHARRRSYTAKQQILWRGEDGDTLFVIVSGKVKVHSATEAGTDVILAVLGQAEWFGEISVIDGAPRSADVTAMERTECVLLDSGALKNAIDATPQLSWHLLRHLARTVRDQNETLEGFASKDVAGRVASVLLRLSENHGQACGKGGIRIAVTLTKTDLKSFVGATREHVTNIMTDFTRLGYLATDNETGHIVILKPDELGRRAQFS